MSTRQKVQISWISQYTKALNSKTQNIWIPKYQYLHFESCHQRSIHKAIIIGECVRYARSNTSKENYNRMVRLFETRLHARGYPPSFTKKTLALVPYDNRQKFLQQTKPEKNITRPPLFKCIAPPQFHQLKQIILENYPLVQKYVNHPRFIALRNRTLHQELVRAKINPTDDQITDLAISFASPNSNHITAGNLPQLHIEKGLLRNATIQDAQLVNICSVNQLSHPQKLRYPIQLGITLHANQKNNMLE